MNWHIQSERSAYWTAIRKWRWSLEALTLSLFTLSIWLAFLSH